MTARAISTAFSPLRLSLAGGGTDIPSFYREYGGLVIGFAITRYVGVMVLPPGVAGMGGAKPTPIGDVFGGHSVVTRKDVPRGTKTCVFSEVPPGVGLGGSGAFLVSLLNAVEPPQIDDQKARQRLADEASSIEIDDLRRGVGHQDHYFAAIGGIRVLEFRRDGTIVCSELALGQALERVLLQKLALFSIGSTRDAAALLRTQGRRIAGREEQTTKSLSSILDLARYMRDRLTAGDLDVIDDVITQHWELKKRLFPGVTSPRVEEAHSIAMNAGASAARLVGAGGTGYLLVSTGSTERRKKVAAALEQHGFVELAFGIDHVGTRFAQIQL